MQSEPPAAETRAAELARRVAAVLRDDAELELDVRRELLTHLEDARAAHLAAGKPEEESLELAVREFGPPEEVAAGLLAANRRRMRLRGLLRLALRGLLVPAAVLLAVLAVGGFLGRLGYFGTFSGMLWGQGDLESLLARQIEAANPDPAVREKNLLLFFGDSRRTTLAERARALWETHPESRVYYANYVMRLQGEIVPPRPPFANREPLSETRFRFLEQELRRGEELDPENALYNYLLAGLFLGRSCEPDFYRPELARRRHFRRWRMEAPEETPEEYVEEEFDLAEFVLDRALLNRTMKELLEGAGKPRLSSYTTELLAERLAALPPARRVEASLLRVMLVANTPGYSLSLTSYQRHAVISYAKLLIAEGRAAEAEPLLEMWYPMAKQMAEDAATLFDVMIAEGCAYGGKKAADVYEKRLGRQEKAEDIRRQWARIERAWKGRRDAFPEEEAHWKRYGERLRRSGSIFAQLVLPNIACFGAAGAVHEEELAPGRRLEQTILDRAGLMYVLLLLLCFILAALAVALRWRFLPGATAAPLLLLPRWRETAKTLGFGVLLPLGAFYLYTRWSNLAGREYAVFWLGGRFGLELLLLGTTILWLVCSMAARAIRRRCAELGIPAPEPRRSRWRRALPWVLGGLWLACLVLRWRTPAFIALAAAVLLLMILLAGGLGAALRELRRRSVPPPRRSFWVVFPSIALVALLVSFAWVHYSGPRTPRLIRASESSGEGSFLSVLAVVLALTPFVVAATVLFSRTLLLLAGVMRDRKHALYHGTLARSLIPFLAAAALRGSLLGRTYLERSEAAQLRHARFAELPGVVEDGLVGMGAAEHRVVRKLRGRLLDVLAEIEAERSSRAAPRSPSPRPPGGEESPDG